MKTSAKHFRLAVGP